jgi:hypothetical protein
MNLEMSLVLVEHVHKVVGGLAGYFDTAAEHSAGRMNASDILRLVMTGQFQLWVVFDKDTARMHGFFATEIRDYPQVKMLVLQHVVLDEHLFSQIAARMVEMFIAYAKDVGCAGVEFTGRPGWKRIAEALGLKTRAVVYERMITEVTP